MAQPMGLPPKVLPWSPGLYTPRISFEAKTAETVLPIHKAQLLSYMKLLDVPVGLLINFHEMKVTDGISRLILPRANQ